MKKYFLTFGLVLTMSAAAWADDHAHEHGHDKMGNFEEHKKKMIEHLDQRISKLQEHRNCASAAADKEAMKKCHEAMKEMREEMKEHRMEIKKEMKSKREEMKKKRKEKRKNKETESGSAPADQ